MKEELLQGGSTIYLVEMIHREKHVQAEPTTRCFESDGNFGKE